MTLPGARGGISEWQIEERKDPIGVPLDQRSVDFIERMHARAVDYGKRRRRRRLLIEAAILASGIGAGALTGAVIALVR